MLATATLVAPLEIDAFSWNCTSFDAVIDHLPTLVNILADRWSKQPISLPTLINILAKR
jgi:hypothetical protein